MMIDSVFETGIAALVLSSFWIAFVLLVRRPVSRWLGARWAYYLWLVPLVGLLAMAIPIKLSREQFGILDIELPAINFVITETVQSLERLQPSRSNNSVTTAGRSAPVTMNTVYVGWLAGFLLALLTLTIRSLRHSRRMSPVGRILSEDERELLETRCPRFDKRLATSIQIVSSDHGPAVAGLLRPILLLPDNFFKRYSTAQQVLVLAHELQHIRRRDLLWLYLARIYRYLFWFNPLVYLAERYLQLDQELSCDEKVLMGQCDKTRRLYGETMLSSLNIHEPLPQVGYLPSFSQIKERITMLKYHRQRNISHLFGILFVSSSIAASTAFGVADRSNSQPTGMSKPVYDELVAIQEVLNAAEYETALENLRHLETTERDVPLSTYELAQIANLTGYTHFLMEDYESAIGAYDRILGGLEESSPLYLSTLKTIAQLQFTVEDYESALEYVKRLEALVDNPAADVVMLVGQAHFQLKQYKPSVQYVSRAIQMVESKGQIVKENWLVLQRVCQSELGDLEAALDAARKLNELYPNSEHDRVLKELQKEIKTSQEA